MKRHAVHPLLATPMYTGYVLEATPRMGCASLQFETNNLLWGALIEVAFWDSGCSSSSGDLF
jgi:hypothetical protein